MMSSAQYEDFMSDCADRIYQNNSLPSFGETVCDVLREVWDKAWTEAGGTVEEVKSETTSA